MFSNVLYFFIEGFCGLKRTGKNEYVLTPHFIKSLSFAKCTRKNANGSLSIEWNKVNGEMEWIVETSGDVVIEYNGQRVKNEQKTFSIKE